MRGGEGRGGEGTSRSEKVEGMVAGTGEFSVVFFRFVNLLDEVSVCPGMALFHGHHLHSLRKVGSSAFFVGRMVMRRV